jgi:HEAT repeat protein
LDGFKGEPESVALWARAVEDSEAPIRMLAASLLGETAGAHRGVAAEALKKLRTDPDDDVREHAAEALTMLDGRDHAAEFNVK